jgi:hypothetical protein
VTFVAACSSTAPTNATATPTTPASPTAGTETAASAPADDIVGSWDVTVTGAPFAPHLMSTNPSRVQEKSNGTGSNDSIGLGSWSAVPGKPHTYQGAFEELNTKQGTSTPVDTLLVTWVITISGDHLTGKAAVQLRSKTGVITDVPGATFDGTRIVASPATLQKLLAAA